MRVKVREVAALGLDIYEQAMPADFGLAEDFLDLERPIVVSGHLDKIDGFILAKVKVTYASDTICARCLDPIREDVVQELELDFEVHKGEEYIDIGESVREEILLGYTPRAVCREDCKGICQGCGVYLNTEPCECDNKKAAN